MEDGIGSGTSEELRVMWSSQCGENDFAFRPILDFAQKVCIGERFIRKGRYSGLK